jgi:hypothetical protein
MDKEAKELTVPWMKVGECLLPLLAIPWVAVQGASLGPEATVKAYFDALKKGDAVRANELTARLGHFGESQVATVIQEYIALHKKPGYAPKVRSSKTIEDCAVVVVLESPTDPDPAYLIKQNGRWRILPELTDYKRDEFELPEVVTARFQKLQRWYRASVGEDPYPEKNPFADSTIQDPAALARLLDQGVDPNTRSRDVTKDSLLFRAVRIRATETVKLLLERGARVDERSAHFKKTALFQAAYDGSMEIAKLLLAKGADVNALDEDNNNVLREAIAGERPEMVRLLMKHGANPNQVNKKGESMKAIAAKYGTPKIREILEGERER